MLVESAAIWQPSPRCSSRCCVRRSGLTGGVVEQGAEAAAVGAVRPCHAASSPPRGRAHLHPLQLLAQGVDRNGQRLHSRANVRLAALQAGQQPAELLHARAPAHAGWIAALRQVSGLALFNRPVRSPTTGAPPQPSFSSPHHCSLSRCTVSSMPTMPKANPLRQPLQTREAPSSWRASTNDRPMTCAASAAAECCVRLRCLRLGAQAGRGAAPRSCAVLPAGREARA